MVIPGLSTGGVRMQEIEGVYVANVTPFEDDGSFAVDEDAYMDHVSWLAEMGVRGIVPFGTNGEGPSVTLDEKLRVLEALFGAGSRSRSSLPLCRTTCPRPYRCCASSRTFLLPLCSSCHPTTSSPSSQREWCASTRWCLKRRAILPSSTISPSTLCLSPIGS